MDKHIMMMFTANSMIIMMIGVLFGGRFMTKVTGQNKHVVVS